jgi:hypothetical protein
MDYQVIVRDPAGNTIRIDSGMVLEKGKFTFDFRQPGMIGGAIIGTFEINWGNRDDWERVSL